MASKSSASTDGPSPGPKRPRTTEVARVERWRGYVTSKFVLNAADGPVYESRPFRWRRAEPPPDKGDARAAYDSLVEQLLSDGWTLAHDGPAWCETSFERPAVVVEPPVVAVEAPPAPDLPPQPLRRIEAPAPASPPPPRPVEPPAPPPQLSVDAPPPRAREGRVPWAAVAALGSGAVGFAAGALLMGGGHDQATTVTSQHTVTATRASTAAVAPASTAAPAPAPPRKPVAPLDIVIVGVRGDGSWIEARRGSKNGKVLFSGVVAPGQRVHLRGRRMWAEFGAAGNLAITVDGRPLTLTGTYEKTFRSRG
jgi:hypothetical protein